MMSSNYFSIQLPSILPALTMSNWGGYYICAIGSVEDIINQESSVPSKMTLSDSFLLIFDTYFGALTASCLSSTLLFIIALPTARIDMLHWLHQVQTVGAPRKLYALHGFGLMLCLSTVSLIFPHPPLIMDLISLINE